MEQRTDGEELGMSFQEIFETAVHADNPVTVSSYSDRPSSIESEEDSSYFHFVDDVGGNITQPSPLVSSCFRCNFALLIMNKIVIIFFCF